MPAHTDEYEAVDQESDLARPHPGVAPLGHGSRHSATGPVPRPGVLGLRKNQPYSATSYD
jgi:hypothetical protein